MRAVIRAQVDVDAPAEHVWAYATDWSRQDEWIPFTRVESEDGHRVGGTVRAWTGVGPIGFWDTMTVTSWVPVNDGAASCEVLHTGAVVRGEGEFAVRSRGTDKATFLWAERLVVPGGPVGALVWRLARPFVQRGAEATLREMADRAMESYVAR